MFNSQAAALSAVFELGDGERLPSGLELFDVILGALNSFLASTDAATIVVKRRILC